MRNGILWVSMLAIVGAVATQTALGQQRKQPATPGAQAVLDEAANGGKYVFLTFYKQKDAATKAMTATVKEFLADRADEALAADVQTTNPAERALVETYGVSRAPMPMTIVVAPNGAITGMFAQKVPAEKLDDVFVTPAMMFTMKNLQENKLVLVAVKGSAKSPAPVAVKDFQSDPHFKDRIITTSIAASDPQEAKFIGQMQIDPKTKVTHTVLLAPPGVIVGKFQAAASKEEIAAALAKAGKCCEDPNCKHHQTAPRSANQPGQHVER